MVQASYCSESQDAWGSSRDPAPSTAEPKIRDSSQAKGPKVVPFGGSYVEFYKVIPKRNYFGAFGKLHIDENL